MQAFLNLFLAAKCPLCDRSTNELLCQYCQNQLDDNRLQKHQELGIGNLPVFVWGNYEGVLKRAIAALKYRNKPEIGELLGELLAEAWLKTQFSKTKTKLVVVPIPLHSDRLRQRGYNQAAIIGRTFAQIARLSYQEGILSRTRATKAQFGLSISERTDNLANAFSVSGNVAPLFSESSILLIDDIYTTGATAQSARQVLAKSGITVWGLAAIATPKKAAKAP